MISGTLCVLLLCGYRFRKFQTRPRALAVIGQHLEDTYYHNRTTRTRDYYKVTYEVNGKQIKATLFSDGKMLEKTAMVLYDPKKPESAEFDSVSSYMKILLLWGFIPLLVWLLLVLFGLTGLEDWLEDRRMKQRMEKAHQFKKKKMN